MKSTVFQLRDSIWTEPDFSAEERESNILVMLFADRMMLKSRKEYLIKNIRDRLPKAAIISCSTAGEISGKASIENTAVCAALLFENTPIRFVCINNQIINQTESIGEKILEELSAPDLKYVMLFGDGYETNCDNLLKMLSEKWGDRVLITGGLAADQLRFEKSVVGLNDDIAEGNIVCVGFYGDKIEVNSGMNEGWEAFGPERVITRSKDRELYEIDGVNALDLYKRYLGCYAEQLPGSSLLFPLSIRGDDNPISVIRTVLKINEKEKSITFAGNMPTGYRVRLMKTNRDKLIDGWRAVKKQINPFTELNKTSFVLTINCVGRKIVLGQRIEEELEGLHSIFPPHTKMAGFFSYGEIGPGTDIRTEKTYSSKMYLHNQSTIITCFAEKH